MGASQSLAEEVGGFRIFKVNPGSPAAESGLEVFFDFITEINGSPMDSDQYTFAKSIQEAENQRTKLVVYNIRTHTSRDVYITPRRWGGAGLLGAIVRFDSLESAENQGMRVLSVFPNSPASDAGLIANKDFLLGTTEVMFRDMDELTEVLKPSLGGAAKILMIANCSPTEADAAETVSTLKWVEQTALMNMTHARSQTTPRKKSPKVIKTANSSACPVTRTMKMTRVKNV